MIPVKPCRCQTTNDFGNLPKMVKTLNTMNSMQYYDFNIFFPNLESPDSSSKVRDCHTTPRGFEDLKCIYYTVLNITQKKGKFTNRIGITYTNYKERAQILCERHDNRNLLGHKPIGNRQ